MEEINQRQLAGRHGEFQRGLLLSALLHNSPPKTDWTLKHLENAATFIGEL